VTKAGLGQQRRLASRAFAANLDSATGAKSGIVWNFEFTLGAFHACALE
jgi:hypothetical protein